MSEYTIKACVESETDLNSVKVYVNGTVVNNDTRGYKVVADGCENSLQRTVTLSAGNNIIEIKAANQAGTATSEKRTIAFAGAAKEKRTALIIGNSNYTDSPLKNPVNDANSIAAELRTLGFDVMLHTDLSQNEMKRKIREFGEKLAANGGVGLFYYAGHGMQMNGGNYLVPVTAQIDKEQDVELEAVNLQRVLGEMEYARNDINIVILDACRNNPFARSFRSAGSNGLASTMAPQGTYIAYATSPGSVAADGSGSNGLYTEELLGALRQPGLKIEDVFKKVRLNVYNRSGKKQLPWDNSSIFGDFYFKK